MISVEEARKRITAALPRLGSETVALSEACGRVLAADVKARRTQPPVAVSAMDGWAVRYADLTGHDTRLRIIGESAAGNGFTGTLGPGQTVRIFTGAPVPAGADTIVIQENACREGDFLITSDTPAIGKFIRPAGLDFSTGDIGIAAGKRLSAADIALAAAMDVPWLNVVRRPRIALLATGDELVRPGEPLGPDQIISSNSYGLSALVRHFGGDPIDLGIARDNRSSLLRLAAAARGADMLVTLGGASVGDHDLIRSVLGQDGENIDFWKVAMRPGKPLMFGQVDGIPLLGLPGNPVSAMVCAIVYLDAAIRAMTGLPTAPLGHEQAPAATDLPENDRRQDFLRARYVFDDRGRRLVKPFSRQDSSMLSRLARADCLIIRPPHAPPVKAGEMVPVQPLGGL